MVSILIIEFDPIIGKILRDGFESDGFDVFWFRNGRNGWNYALDNQPDLILLNLMIPGIQGINILRTLRRDNQLTPVVILSVDDDERTKLKAFEAGCDDFLTIPFSLGELFGRAKAILRRTSPSLKAQKLISGNLILNTSSHVATLDGKELQLTRCEFKILSALIVNEGKVVPRYKLLDEIWGEETDVTTRTIDMHISRIRSKYPEIGNCIMTVFQSGYKWETARE